MPTLTSPSCTNPKVEIKPSGIHGMGLFVDRPLREGEVIGLVQRFAVLHLDSGIDTCYHKVGRFGRFTSNGWDGAVASYEGSGKWLVTVELQYKRKTDLPFTYTWEVYENTLTVHSLNVDC